MSVPPVQIITAYDEEIGPRIPVPDPRGNRHLTVNRADRGDSNVVVSFNDRKGVRDAIGIPPDAAIEMAIALLNAAQEVKAP